MVRKPIVQNWYVLRVTTWDDDYLKTLNDWFAEDCGAYVIAKEIGKETEQEHIHCLINIVGADRDKIKKSLTNKFRSLFKNTELVGNTGRYSISCATWTFETAAGYTLKCKNVPYRHGVCFEPELWDGYTATWIAKRRKESQDNDFHSKGGSVKHKALKRCRDENIRPYMHIPIATVVYETIKEADVIYSSRQAQDLCGYIKMQLTDNSESVEAKQTIEQWARFM